MSNGRSVGAARAGLALLVVLINGGIMTAMLAVRIPPENKDILLLLVGGLVNATGIICGYYFASSQHPKTNSPPRVRRGKRNVDETIT